MLICALMVVMLLLMLAWVILHTMQSPCAAGGCLWLLAVAFIPNHRQRYIQEHTRSPSSQACLLQPASGKALTSGQRRAVRIHTTHSHSPANVQAQAAKLV